MSFLIQDFSRISSSQNSDSSTTWGYKSTTDTLAAINASGYFDSIAKRLEVGHFINIRGTDGTEHFHVVTSTVPVTIAGVQSSSAVKPESLFPSTADGPSLTVPFYAFTELTSGQTTPVVFTASIDMTIMDILITVRDAAIAGNTVTIKNDLSSNDVFSPIDVDIGPGKKATFVNYDANETFIVKGNTFSVVPTQATLFPFCSVYMLCQSTSV